jgi:hypothetical protein
MAAEKLDESLRKKLERDAELRVEDAKRRLDSASSDTYMGQPVEQTPERDLQKAQAAVDLKKAEAELAAVKRNLDAATAQPPAAANESMRRMLAEQEQREVELAEAAAAQARADVDAPSTGGLDELNLKLSQRMFAEGKVESIKDRQAREHDQPAQEKIGGCTPKVIAAIGVVLAVIGFVVFMVTRDDDSSSSSNPVAAGGGGGATGKSSIVGHWDLSSGLNDPTGRNTGVVCGSCGGVTGINLSASSASLDISETTITGGSYQTGYEENAAPCVGHKYSYTAASVSGTVDAVKGYAQVIVDGAYTQDGPCDENSSSSHAVSPTKIIFFVYFKDGTLFGCYALSATLDSCAEPAGESMAVFA